MIIHPQKIKRKINPTHPTLELPVVAIVSQATCTVQYQQTLNWPKQSFLIYSNEGQINQIFNHVKIYSTDKLNYKIRLQNILVLNGNNFTKK